jgi:hypothetical protein
LGSNALDNNFTSTELLTSKLKFTDHGKSFLMNHLGFRYATIDEVAKAREADTAGGVNQWTAIRPIQPRNLPGKVNEYGFDTLQTPSETSRFWWVVQE